MSAYVRENAVSLYQWHLFWLQLKYTSMNSAVEKNAILWYNAFESK